MPGASIALSDGVGGDEHGGSRVWYYTENLGPETTEGHLGFPRWPPVRSRAKEGPPLGIGLLITADEGDRPGQAIEIRYH